MKKILFFAEAVSLAHVGRPLVLAKWAHENNIEVHFAASEKALKKSKADSNGFATHPLLTIEENLFYERVHNCKFFYQVNELKEYVKQEHSLIIKVNPDLIVSDFRLTSAISAELAGKPLLNLSNSYWCPHYSCKFPPPESGIFNLLPTKTTNLLFNLIRPFFFKNFGKELNQTREHFGLTRKKDFRELYTAGNYTAYMDIPQFVKINSLPENHFFLGPIVWSPDINHLSIVLENKNNIYISMGSTGDNRLIPEIIDVVLKNDLNVILSGINASEKSSLINQIPQLAGRSIIEPLIQADEILPFCKLTICHGGSGTVYQSVAKGIPVLCFPKNPDQSLVSMAVTQNNIGRYLSGKNSNSSSIDKMIKECISNEIILQKAKNMQSIIHQWDTKKHWVQFLLKFKTVRKIIA